VQSVTDGVPGAVEDRDGPDTMTFLVPVFPESSEPEGGTTITFADGPGAVGFLVVLGDHWEFPEVPAFDVPVGIDFWVDWIVTEFESVSGFGWVADEIFSREGTFEFFSSASVTEPELLARFVDHVDGLTGTGDERVSSFWEAPASIKTVPGDTFINWLQPRDQLFKF